LERNFFYDGSEIDRRIDLSLVPIVGGVAMATYGEVNFNWIGFLTALIASVITGSFTH
jgi:1,4-dihydroxy-2-naphthoate octaprenyltransferase